jgi:hypothetical protein
MTLRAVPLLLALACSGCGETGATTTDLGGKSLPVDAPHLADDGGTADSGLVPTEGRADAADGPAGADGLPATAADRLVEALGVATHFNWAQSIYTTQYTALRQAMVALGVRYYRTGAGTDRGRFVLNDLYKQHGIRGVFNVSQYAQGYHSQLVPGSAAKIIDALVADGAAGLYAVEGPNEYDHSDRQSWVKELRDYQLEIYKHVKGSPKLSHVKVGGPSLVTTVLKPQSSQLVGDISDRVDIGVHHHYVPFGNFHEKGLFQVAQLLANNNYGAGPLLITETGVCTNTGASSMCVSEKAQAKYLPRSAMEIFRQHRDNKLFFYELVDQGATQGNAAWNWGMIRSDLKPKLAYHALKNLVGLLAEPKGPAFKPGALDYTLAGGGPDLRQVLLQRSDGRFYLVLWQAVRSFDDKTKKDLDPPTAQVTVAVEPAAKIRVFRPTPLDAADLTAASMPRKVIGSAKTVVLAVPDHLVVVEIDPP